MAIIRFEGRDMECPDGSRIYETCDELGVPFGCTEGLCGTCICRVVEGMQNLKPLNEKEADMGLSEGQRLACQCVAVSGVIELELG
ncbi:MAG: 2Fe-2S iron-sulfur cluster-binding protein [Candidatus Hydrogenedentota bacterium]